MFKKILSLFLSIFLILISIIPAAAAWSPPTEDYAEKFTGSNFPSEKIKNYYLIFTMNYSNTLYLITCDNPITPYYYYSKSNSTVIESVYFSKSSFTVYSSTDGISFNIIKNDFAIVYDRFFNDNNEFDLNYKFIYYSNHDIKCNGDVIFPKGGDYLRYYDYYNNTNYSGEFSDDAGFWNKLWGYFDNMGNLFNNLGTSILEGIKSIFIPDTNELNASIDHLKNTFITTFGIGAYDLSPILSSEMKITDHKGKINIAGLEFEATFFDVDYLVKGIASFRPYIRGFIILMMAFYNINQFLTIIGQNPISFGSFTKNDSPSLPSTTHLLHD